MEQQTGERVVTAGDLCYDMLKMITAWTVFKTKDQLMFIMAYSSTWCQYNLASGQVVLHSDLLQYMCSPLNCAA